jgi:hypothetical protein
MDCSSINPHAMFYAAGIVGKSVTLLLRAAPASPGGGK